MGSAVDVVIPTGRLGEKPDPLDTAPALVLEMFPGADELEEEAVPDPEAPPRHVDALADAGEATQDDGPFLSWDAFWAADQREPEWLFDELIARGRAHVIYAVHKAGKSLLMLFAALQLVEAGCVVVYLDYEMTEDDLRERLEDMGAGPTTDLERLRYALLPSLPPLDSREGAAALLELIDRERERWPDRHVALVIDTFGRAVAGDENPADTVRAFFRLTGAPLKQRGVTWIRLDHAGKDDSRGQRGSSAKGDDVDVIWRLVPGDDGATLKRDAARMGWVPEALSYQRLEEPLRYKRVAESWPAGTHETAQKLDELGIAPEASIREAKAALTIADAGRRGNIVNAAQRYRRLNQEGHGS